MQKISHSIYKKKTDVRSIQFIDVLTTEGGLKISDKKDFGIDNMKYLNIGIEQQFGYSVKLYHAFTSLSQNYIDFNYKQKEYYGNMSIQITEGLTLIPAYHYTNTTINNQSTLKSDNSLGSTSSEIQFKAHLFHFGVKKQWNRFSLTPNIIYYSIKNIDLSKSTKLQYGLNMGYTLKTTHDKLWLGAGGELINSSIENNFIWNVKALYTISPKTYLYFKYLNANTSNFAFESAMYYYNAVSTLVDNLNVTFGYYFTPKFSWYLNYQYENAKDLDYDVLFTYNTIITGIKINL